MDNDHIVSQILNQLVYLNIRPPVDVISNLVELYSIPPDGNDRIVIQGIEYFVHEDDDGTVRWIYTNNDQYIIFDKTCELPGGIRDIIQKYYSTLSDYPFRRFVGVDLSMILERLSLYDPYGIRPKEPFENSIIEAWSDELGLLHRTDGPAVIAGDYHEWWYLGLEHRDGGLPAKYIVGDSYARYCVHGILHRVGGPAKIEDGDESWYYFGEMHRTDGPAFVSVDENAFYIGGNYFDIDTYIRIIRSTMGLTDEDEIALRLKYE